MVLTFNAKLHTQLVHARLTKLKKRIETRGSATTSDLVSMGKETARILVPKGTTGWLYRTIQGKVIRKGVNSKGVIFLSPSIVPNDGVHRRRYNGQQWKYPSFNLARWMHESPRALARVRSGDPRFMYKTEEVLRGKKGDVLRRNFRNITL